MQQNNPTSLFQYHCRFSVYKVSYSEAGRLIVRHVIVLKDTENNLIIKFTDFADYVLYRVARDDYAFRNDIGSLYSICDFLNYVFFEHYERYKITSVFQLEKKMFQDYLDDYSTKTVGKSSPHFPTREAIASKRAAISLFGEMLCHYHKSEMKHLKRGQLIKTQHITDTRNKSKSYYNYLLKFRYYGNQVKELQQLDRDMPLNLADRIVKMAEIYDPELCFPIVLQLYGGLRDSEVCNVRRKESPLGPGIITTTYTMPSKTGGTELVPTSFQIDLRTEYNLRSDYRSVGDIKRHRWCNIYGPFVKTVYRYYKRHLGLIESKKCEETMPLFLNKNKSRENGTYMAMCSSDYRRRVISLFTNRVLPSLKNDTDPDLSNYYYRMQTHTWGLHAFRHWFTVYLIVCGVDDVVQLRDLRGDSEGSDAAETYIRRKGILLKTYNSSL